MAEVLRDFGVASLKPGQRREFAQRLTDDGATPAAVYAVCEFIERQAGHDPKLMGSRLALVLKPGVWRGTLKAAQAHARRKAAAEVERAPRRAESDHGETRRAEEDRARREARPEVEPGRVYAFLKWDRAHQPKTRVREAAELWRIPMDRMAEVIRQGAATYPNVDPDQAVAELLGVTASADGATNTISRKPSKEADAT